MYTIMVHGSIPMINRYPTASAHPGIACLDCKLLEVFVAATIPDIQRVTSVSILGVTTCICNHLSVSEHIQSVISKYARSMQALRIL